MAGIDIPTNVTEDEVFGMEKLNKLLESLRAAVFAPIPLGGSLSTGHPGTTAQRVINAQPFVLPHADYGGGTWRARVFCVCEDGGVATITPKIRNVTDDEDAVTGSACSGEAADWSGTNQQQVLTFTPGVGKIYELWATKSSASAQCWITGWLERIP